MTRRQTRKPMQAEQTSAPRVVVCDRLDLERMLRSGDLDSLVRSELEAHRVAKARAEMRLVTGENEENAKDELKTLSGALRLVLQRRNLLPIATILIACACLGISELEGARLYALYVALLVAGLDRLRSILLIIRDWKHKERREAQPVVVIMRDEPPRNPPAASGVKVKPRKRFQRRRVDRKQASGAWSEADFPTSPMRRKPSIGEWVAMASGSETRLETCNGEVNNRSNDGLNAADKAA